MNINKNDSKLIAEYFDKLWPIMRSLTGDGVRKTHKILSELIPLDSIEIPSGTTVFDWTVPKEWVVVEAYIIDPNGNKILDIAENNLHLLNYSIPFRGTLSRAELDNYLYSLPELPDAIPYVMSYYKPRWGFCLSQEQRDLLPDGDYQVVVDTDHIDGHMTLAEVVLPGIEDKEILFSTYNCHPSMANNELSGPLVTAMLCKRMAELPNRRFTYRFAFLVETIGSIAYLARNQQVFKEQLHAGYVITCTGNDTPFTYKRSRIGDSAGDRAAEITLKNKYGNNYRVDDFDPLGSDERQYCSPGFNLPVGSLMRTKYGEYPEYHTSKDNRDFISFQGMAEAVDTYFDICQTLEKNRIYENTIKYCEPQLGPRGLYPTLGTRTNIESIEAISWFLNLADGSNDLIEISRKSGVGLDELYAVAEKCVSAGIAKYK